VEENSPTKLLPQRTTNLSQFYFPGAIPNWLPADWNTIILAAKVGIGPVGVRPSERRELPP
jgi:hypothetical protein